ncbi:MAG: hypothetical protein AAGH68_08675 [Pseudomonadota bacterium]
MARLGVSTLVSVHEDVVEVRVGEAMERLTAGDRLRWTPEDGARRDSLWAEGAAAWRHGRLLADGLTLAEAAAIIERHAGGEILVVGERANREIVSGSFDLSRPQSALRVLAAAHGAKIYAAPALVSVLVLR